MKSIFTYTTLLFFSFFNAQNVGINSTNPQEELHVAGGTSTIRVDGLNEVNNVNNLGQQSTSRVFVNEFGDLVLGEMTDNVQLIFDSENYLQDVANPTSIILQTGGSEVAATWTRSKP